MGYILHPVAQDSSINIACRWHEIALFDATQPDANKRAQKAAKCQFVTIFHKPYFYCNNKQRVTRKKKYFLSL